MIRLMPLMLTVSLITAGCGNVISQNKNPSVCFGGSCFQVELADTAAEREQGLMNRQELAPDAGMLFIFPQEDFYNFWMKDTLMPLDIIWLDENKKIVAINKNAPPCQTNNCPQYSPEAPALYVLEVNAGTAERLNLKKGDYFVGPK